MVRGARVVVLAVAAAAVVALTSATAARAASLTADYRFAGTYASSVAGAPALAPLGPGPDSFATETVRGTSQQVLRFPEGSGVSLTPTTGVVPSDSYTIAVLARLSTTAGYRRYVDFKNGTADTGLYDLGGALDFFSYGSGSLTPIKPDVYDLVVLTRSAAGQLDGYVDGARQFTFDDAAAGDGVISPDAVLRFFRDNETGANTEHSAGAVARIRLWNGPLSPVEVAALGGAPAPAPTAAPPVLGRSVGAQVTDGQVSVRLPGSNQSVPLTQAGSLPVGTVVDATRGDARITTAVPGRPPQSGVFGGGVFQVRQNARERGVTELGLVVAPAAARSCTAATAAGGAARIAARRKLSAKILTLLHASVQGRFRTRGRYSAATVRGTRWDTVDRCDGTLTRVFAGVVVVSDLRRHRQVVLRAGQSYLAPAA